MALTSAVVVNVPLERLRNIMLTNAEVVNILGRKLAGRLRQMTQQRTLLGLPNVSQRVCCQLWSLTANNSEENEACAIKNPPTHQEIAIMLNVSRETVTRVFQKLQNQRIVQRNGPGNLLITNLTALKELAEGNKEL
jgi:CRP-like cAMP-binding protein